MTIIVIDLEATGLDPLHDEIVSLAAVELDSHTWRIGETREWRFRPRHPIPEHATSIHSITNEMAATYPTFAEQVEEILPFLGARPLAGFNLLALDLPLLWRAFDDCGLTWEPCQREIIDVGTLFKKREARSLEAAVRFYLGREHTAAHDATGDAIATARVLAAQVHRYELGDRSVDAIGVESLFAKPLDVCGSIVVGSDGRAAYGFGKHRGVAVEDEPGFARWMLDRDFHPHVKEIVRWALAEAERPKGSGLVFVDDIDEIEVPF